MLKEHGFDLSAEKDLQTIWNSVMSPGWNCV